MKGTWLHKNQNEKLILFCNGWGMDEYPFSPLGSSEYDVYILFDYRDLTLPEPLIPVTNRYQEVSLVGWSMGVWVGQKIFSDLNLHLHRAIAINGTLCPIDDGFGISQKIYNDTLLHFNEVTRMKFYRRMCREKTNLRLFLSHQPKRSFQEQQEELKILKDTVIGFPPISSLYKTIIISEYDWVIPTENQRKYWQGKSIVEIAGFHFCFYLWQSWDHLLYFVDSQ